MNTWKVGDIVKVIVDSPIGTDEIYGCRNAIGCVKEYDKDEDMYLVKTGELNSDGWWWCSDELTNATDKEVREKLVNLLN